jgi:hypothetical protein
MAQRAALRQCLRGHLAGLKEDRGGILIGLLARHDADPPLADQPRSRLTVTQGQGAQVLAVELQQVECQIAFNSDPPFASNNDPTSVRNGRAGLGGPRVVMLGF